MGSYRVFCTVEIVHRFFDGGGCPVLDCVPTPESERLLQRAGLLRVSTANGITLLYDDARIEALRLCVQEADEPGWLRWKIFVRDPLFMNYTDPLPSREDAILYFDNLTAFGHTDGVYRLHAGETVSHAAFKDLEAVEVQSCLSKRDRLVRPHFLIAIRLRDFFGSKGKCCGLHARRYRITFKTRETIWLYHLNTSLPLKQPYVLDLDRRVEFANLGFSVLANDRPALTFRARHPLPLQARSVARFQLREKHVGGEKILINRLPVASPDHLYQDTLEGTTQFVSEIFVHC